MANEDYELNPPTLDDFMRVIEVVNKHKGLCTWELPDKTFCLNPVAGPHCLVCEEHLLQLKRTMAIAGL